MMTGRQETFTPRCYVGLACNLGVVLLLSQASMQQRAAALGRPPAAMSAASLDPPPVLKWGIFLPHIFEVH